jgi:hypothetical protein
VEQSDLDSRLLIHIGYPKTATTWLQTRVFPLDLDGWFQPIGDRRSILTTFVTADGFRFDPCIARATLERDLRGAVSGGRVPVISHERLAGIGSSGGYDAQPIADRLARTFPEARVLIVIREQERMVLSTWQQYVREGGACSLKRYLDPPRDDNLPLFRFEQFEYDAIINYYRQRFTPQRVCVLPLELLARTPHTFVRTLGEFAGVSTTPEIDYSAVYAGLSGLSLAILRRMNYVVGRNDVNPAAPFRGHRRIGNLLTRLDRVVPERVSAVPTWLGTSRVRHLVGDRYRLSNVTTSELTKLDLAGLGYRC